MKNILVVLALSLLSLTAFAQQRITGTVVDVRLIFKLALEHNATSIILSHNHPSGKLVASDADKEITKKLKFAGEQLDIKVLDHIIITEKGYLSFQDEGIF